MKVLDFIVCEDIRNEVGDKMSLMGVYVDSMVVNFHKEEKWPFVTRMGFYVKLDPDGAPTYPDCKFQVARDGVIKSSLPLHVDSDSPSNLFTMAINVVPFAIREAGVLDFSLEFSGPGLAPLTVQLPSFEVKVGLVGATPSKVSLAQSTGVPPKAQPTAERP